MKKYSILLIVSILGLSCNNALVEKPKNVIDEETMINILYDLSLLDAVKNQNTLSSITNYNPNEYIYKKYKIDSTQFAQNNKYYASDISRYKKMYAKVNSRLMDLKTEIDAKMVRDHEKQAAPISR